MIMKCHVFGIAVLWSWPGIALGEVIGGHNCGNLVNNQDDYCEPLDDQVVFWLMTRGSGENTKTSRVSDKKLFNGEYDYRKPTILTIPDYVNKPPSLEFANTTRRAYLEEFDGQVITVYWFKENSNYSEARRDVPGAARVLTKFIRRMITEESLDLSSLAVIGFSMGAHIAGITGRRMRARIPTVIGLDPAAPEFIPGSKDVIGKDSAGFVQIIHSSDTAEAIETPLGHVDFYPNKGFPAQPGCETLTDYRWTVCSHARAFELYAESIANPMAFPATKCSSYDDWLTGACNNNEKANMGQNTSRTARGSFFLRTGASSPYGLGGSGSQAEGGGTNGFQPLNSTEENSVHFWLVTKETKDDPIISNVTDERLFRGAFNSGKPAVVLIPGYGNYPGMSPFVDQLQEAYLKNSVQLIIVYWDAATGDFRVAVDEFVNVARVIAQFLERMAAEESLDISSLTMIGHSSGAQIGGTAGRLVKTKLSTLVGLDAVRPLVLPGGDNVINTNSAQFVQLIHTSATVLGILAPLGHVDFYVNNAGLPPQPGCESSDFVFPINPVCTLCSHLRAIDLFAESIHNPRAFPAVKCNNYEEFKSNTCRGGSIIFMGQNTTRRARGTYYLRTRASSPYSLAQAGTCPM